MSMNPASRWLMLAAALAILATGAAQGQAPASPAAPGEDAHAMRLALRRRQERISARALAYLWDQRLDPETGRVGRVQVRYLQALCYLALVADGQARAPEYQKRLARVIGELRQPIAGMKAGSESRRKVFVGSSRDFLAFETHAVVALAYEQLAASELGDPAANEQFLTGAGSAIDYLMDYRKRGRDYARAGGWPVNANPYNRNRPDRRCTAWVLTLLKAHTYNGGKVNSTALKEAPNFVLAAQRLAPEMTEALREAGKLHGEWAPKMRRGAQPPVEAREKINNYFEYTRQLEESGGFGLDTIGIVTPTPTAVGLYTMGLFDFEDAKRHRAAADAYLKMPLAWEAQRFFLTQFFAARGLYLYSRRYRTVDFEYYMKRLLTLMEQKQGADGSFPMGSRGVEELTQMETVYTTAMCVLIVNANRGNLIFDRPPH